MLPLPCGTLLLPGVLGLSSGSFLPSRTFRFIWSWLLYFSCCNTRGHWFTVDSLRGQQIHTTHTH